MSIRDRTIDQLRGFAMFWVIVVHDLYWGNFFSNDYVNLLKSFCLFEMPLFFFIAGASSSFSKADRYFDFVCKRFQRLLLPYWVFAIICAFLSIFKYRVEGSLDISTGIRVLISWLIPFDRQITSISYLTWALWFIPVYLCVVLIIPGLKRVKQSKLRIRFGFLLLAIFVATCILRIGWIQNVVFYSLWTYIGLFYSDLKSAIESQYFRKYFIYIVIIGTGVIFLSYYLFDQTLDMQYNKFPPNIIFFSFSCVTMALIALTIPYLTNLSRVFEHHFERYRLIHKIFDLFSIHSITIFLYQVFAFNLTIRVTNGVIPGNSLILSIIKSILCLAMTIPACAGLAAIFGRIENIKINK